MEEKENICSHSLLYCFGKWTKTYWEDNRQYFDAESRLYYMGLPKWMITDELMKKGIKRHIMIHEDMLECKCLYCREKLSINEKKIKHSKIINYDNIGNSSEYEFNYLANYVQQERNFNERKKIKLLKKEAKKNNSK